MEDRIRKHRVELPVVRKFQCVDFGEHQFRVAVTRLDDHLRRVVDAEHGCPLFRQLGGQCTVAAAEIENPLPGRHVHMHHQRFPVFCDDVGFAGFGSNGIPFHSSASVIFLRCG
ncbi:hypothetical protein SDC9_159037 [bioreactor metagenome]|uniref:Uncharacterized protein n=1 Tax=bioreactor metagenome TaxID=1076179 RepID=A0A645FEF8_9ZZZZ